MSDVPFARVKTPSDYEKMVLMGLFLSGQLSKHHARMTEGRLIRMAVPASLPQLKLTSAEVRDEYTRIEIATFKVTHARHGRYLFDVYGSLRPEEVESWLKVGHL